MDREKKSTKQWEKKCTHDKKNAHDALVNQQWNEEMRDEAFAKMLLNCCIAYATLFNWMPNRVSSYFISLSLCVSMSVSVMLYFFFHFITF